VLKIDLNYHKKILFINLQGVLNRSTAYKINNYLIPVLLKHQIKYGILNLKDLVEIDDDGLDSLLNIKYAFKNNNGLVYLCEYSSFLLKKINKLHLKKINSHQEILHSLGV
jgi:anti-anti-sigma factor